MDFEQYGRVVLEANGLAYRGVSPWLFADGMGFLDTAVWWPSTWELRPVPHEGLDLVQFTGTSGIKEVGAGFLVVSPVNGVVVEICNDYLAKTVWVTNANKAEHLIALSHVSPMVSTGQRLICGDPVGRITYPVTTVPHHLHLSVLAGKWQAIKRLDWDGVHGQSGVRFIDPCF